MPAARSSRSRSSSGPPPRPSSGRRTPAGSSPTAICPCSTTSGPTSCDGLRPRLFLRTTEFLWQEGHTAHETEDEAIAEALRILHEVYADTAEQVLAIPVLRGRKSASERFPGAVETFAIEALMRDNKALQAGTSHYLGENFARAYNVRFIDRSGKERYAYATSWGASTRLVGGLIMAHGDDSGLRLPPAVAPHQIVIVPISGGDGGWARVREASEALATMLRAAGLRVRLDDREDIRPGFKFNEWELKGVPLRVELGERELDAGQATLVRRDTGARETASADRVAGRAGELLAEIQQRLLDEARAFRAEHTLESPKSYEVLREFLAAAAGLAIAPWCGSPSCEDRVKRETRATIRCLPLERVSIKAECIVCEAPAVEHASWSQAY